MKDWYLLDVALSTSSIRCRLYIGSMYDNLTYQIGNVGAVSYRHRWPSKSATDGYRYIPISIRLGVVMSLIHIYLLSPMSSWSMISLIHRIPMCFWYLIDIINVDIGKDISNWYRHPRIQFLISGRRRGEHVKSDAGNSYVFWILNWRR